MSDGPIETAPKYHIRCFFPEQNLAFDVQDLTRGGGRGKGGGGVVEDYATYHDCLMHTSHDHLADFNCWWRKVVDKLMSLFKSIQRSISLFGSFVRPQHIAVWLAELWPIQETSFIQQPHTTYRQVDRPRGTVGTCVASKGCPCCSVYAGRWCELSAQGPAGQEASLAVTSWCCLRAHLKPRKTGRWQLYSVYLFSSLTVHNVEV